jgi:hypothetical protein
MVNMECCFWNEECNGSREQYMVYAKCEYWNGLLILLKIEDHEPHKKPGGNKGAPEM